MKQRTKPKLRLLALNLVLVLLCSLALPITAGAASESIDLGYGTSDKFGTNWAYSAKDRVLRLRDYQGGPIRVTGDLTIYSYGDVSVSGSGRSHAVRAGGNGASLYVYVQDGTMRLSAQQDACGIIADGEGATVGVVPINGDAVIQSGTTGAGVCAPLGRVIVMTPPKAWTSSDGTVYYDGRGMDDQVFTGKATIQGPTRPSNNAAIVGILVMLDTDGSVITTGDAAAIACEGLVIGSDDYASTSFGIETGSTMNMTIRAGGDERAVEGLLDETPSQGIEIAQQIQGDWKYYSSGNPRTTPTELTLYPKTYTTTINGDGGTYNGQGTVQAAQKYPAHVKLADYAFARPDYQLTGFSVDGKTVAADYEFIPTKDTTVTAQWQFVGKNDVSEKILFPQTSTEAVYTGEAMALSQFVGVASLDGQSGDAFTYTLRKDGGNARDVTLDSTVTDAGTYTVTAKYEDEDNLGTQSRTFTIRKATPVLTVPQDTTTVIVGNQERVAVTAKLPTSDALLPVTYENSNTKALSVEGAEGEAVLTGKAAGSATVTVSYAGDANINPVSASFQVEVIDLPLQEIAFTDGADKSATYGDSPITDAAVNHSAGGGAITYTSSNEAVATVDGQGQVTITGAGEAKITATAAAVPGAFAATSVDYTLTVAPKAVTAQASAITKTFDGTTAAQATVTLDGLVNGDVLTQGVDYAVTARFDDPNAGTGKTVQVEVALKNTALAANYTLTNPAITLSDGVIEKAAARELPVQNVYVRYDDVAQHSQDVSRLLPGNAGARAYSLGSTEDAYGLLGNAFAVDADGQVTFSLREGLTEDAVGQSASAPIILSSDNYADSTADVVVNVVYEFVPVLDVEDISAAYDGAPIADTAIRGTATYDGQTVEGTWSFKEGQNLTAVADSGPKTVVFTPTDTAVYAQVEATVLVTIDKADPTGEPSYTAIRESGHTLADAALGVGTITPGGTIAWDDGDATIVESNTAYGWTFTPDDTDNYNLLTGTITPYKRSSGGGGSSGASRYSVEVKSADNGSVSVSPSRASRGDLVTVTVKPDEGYVLDTLTITDRDGDKIDYKSKGDGKYTFTMPASSVTVKATFTEEELAFTDMPADAYYAEAVKWAVTEGITSGTTATTFSPNSGCTRGQVVTFLWRAAGEPEPSSTVNPFTDVSADAYNYKAILWAYENGITGGTTATTFAPNATCTRAQIVTFLYRANGQTVDSGNVFTDVPADAYYADAVNWAVAEGITGGTTATTFAPNATCTRAQVVTFLYRDMAQ